MKRLPNITITIFIALIFSLALSFILPKNDEKYLGEMFWTRKTFAPAHYDVILLGDSRLYRGLSPTVIEKCFEKNIKVLNFGFSNGGLNPEMYKAAEQKIDKKSQHKTIVLGITANTLTNFTITNEQYKQEKNRPREEIIERLYFNPLQYWFSAVSPETLKEYYFGDPDSAYYINHYYMNGYVKSIKYPVDTLYAIPSYIKDFTNYKVNPQLIKTLVKQVKQWNSEGINVFALRPPVPHAMKMLEDTMGLYNQTYIEKQITQAGGIWLDTDTAKFTTYDGSHLDIESADKLSKIVGKALSDFYTNN